MINKIILSTFLLTICYPLYAQKIFSVAKIDEVKTISSGFHPVLIKNTNNIIFSSPASKGLFFFDAKSQTTKTLNTDNGAGFHFAISENGKTVVYKSYIMDATGKRQSSIYKQDIASGKKTSIIKNKRALGSFSYFAENLLYMHNDLIIADKTKLATKSGKKTTAVFTDNNLNLILLENKQKTILNPLGNGNYIWVSLSPDREKILFNKAGTGTFVCDTEGKIIANLGRLHAAKWASDGKWIIGMDDFDDGQKYISSQIVFSTPDGKTRQSLALKQQKTALFPDIAPDYSKIVFNDEKGKVFIISLKN